MSHLIRQAYLSEREAAYLRTQRDGLALALDRKSNELRWMQESLSWRLTAPLRLLHRLSERRPVVTQPRHGHLPWLDAWVPERVSGRLAVNVSSLHQRDHGTGIQRVVRGVTRTLAAHGAVPVCFGPEQLEDVSGCYDGSGAGSRRMNGFDRLLMLDAAWDLLPANNGFFARCGESGIEVVACVYDLVPLQHPETCKGDLPQVFRRWLEAALSACDAFVCISEATAQGLAEFIRENPELPCRTRAIGWWPLGEDFDEGLEGERGWALTPEAPYVLSVGTFEPRKNQRFLLDAFTRWWAEEDLALQLVFAGRPGWGMEGWIDEIERHPEFARRLWVFESPTDSHLRRLYEEASVIAMPSLAEGFGLPVVEGAKFGKPVVLSDLPVFREIVVGHGYFFRPGDVASLKRALDAAIAPGAPLTRTRGTTWAESTRALVGMIEQDGYQIRISEDRRG